MSIAELPPPATTDTPPHNTDAEQAVLGAMLTDPAACTDVPEIITPDDYWTPRHQDIARGIEHLIAHGQGVDTLTLAAHLRTTHGKHYTTRLGGDAYLHQLTQGVVTTANATWHADIIADLARRRQIQQAATNLAGLAYAPLDQPLEHILEQATQQLAGIRPSIPGHHDIPGETIDAFLAGDADDEYDWLIPGFLERRDRLILTAAEGSGKSTLLRQWATQAAAGINPTTGHDTTPCRVLLLDLENSKRQTRRKLRTLHAAAGRALDPHNLIVHCKIDGIDLTAPTDRAWLDQLIGHHRPDILITGPIYKMATGNPNDEVDAKPVAMTLDKLREKHDIAIVLEAHSRKGEGGKNRPKEPFGWSGWMRWPEFGIHLGDEGELTHWRGMRDERTLPHQLNRGGRWPFEAVLTIEDQQLAAIRGAIREAGRRLSLRDIQDATGIPKTTVGRLMNQHRAEFDAGALWGHDGGDNA